MSLYKHQVDYLESQWDSKYYALFWEMGSGKTRAVLENFEKLFAEKGVHTLIVIAPNGVHPNWPNRQARLWMHSGYNSIVWNDKSNTKKFRQHVADVVHDHEVPLIVAINVEAFSRKGGSGVTFINQIIDHRGAHRAFLVIDESSTIKNPKANRSKIIVSLSNRCAYRRILTGTPITQSPFDIWMQGEALEKNIWRMNYYMFRQHYGQFRVARFGARSFEELVSYRNLDELKLRIDSMGSQVVKADCLDLPPKVYEVREIPLTDEQKKAYAQMRDYYATQVNSEMVTTDSALTKLTKLHQITTGHIIDEDGKTHRLKHLGLQAIDDALRELGCKTIIYSKFVEPLYELVEHLGERAVEYSGRTSDDARQRAVDRFQEDDTVDVIVISLESSGAYGLDLYAAGAVIYYNNGYSLERRMQSEDRAHRPGQEHDCVTYIDMIRPHTVDERVQLALTNKIDVASQVVDLMESWLR